MFRTVTEDADWATRPTLFVLALLALYAPAAAIQGWLWAPLGWTERWLLIVAGMLPPWPGPLSLHVLGAIPFFLFLGWSRWRRTHETPRLVR